MGLLGINVQDGDEAAWDVVERTGVTYELARDTDGALFTAFGGFGMPTTVFVDAQGRVTAQHTGAITRAELDALVLRRLRAGGRMSYRDVSVTEVREVLRLWVRGESLCSIAAKAGRVLDLYNRRWTRRRLTDRDYVLSDERPASKRVSAALRGRRPRARRCAWNTSTPAALGR